MGLRMMCKVVQQNLIHVYWLRLLVQLILSGSSLAQMVRAGVTQKGQWKGLGARRKLSFIPIPKQVKSRLH